MTAVVLDRMLLRGQSKQGKLLLEVLLAICLFLGRLVFIGTDFGKYGLHVRPLVAVFPGDEKKRQKGRITGFGMELMFWITNTV